MRTGNKNWWYELKGRTANKILLKISPSRVLKWNSLSAKRVKIFVSRKRAVFRSRNAVKLSISHHLRTYPSFIGVLIFCAFQQHKTSSSFTTERGKKRKLGSKWRWKICILFFTPALVRWLKRCFNGRWRWEDNLPLFHDKPFVLIKFSLADDYETFIVAENCARCKRGAEKTLNLMWRTNLFGELNGNWRIAWKKTPAIHHRFCRECFERTLWP